MEISNTGESWRKGILPHVSDALPLWWILPGNTSTGDNVRYRRYTFCLPNFTIERFNALLWLRVLISRPLIYTIDMNMYIPAILDPKEINRYEIEVVTVIIADTIDFYIDTEPERKERLNEIKAFLYEYSAGAKLQAQDATDNSSSRTAAGAPPPEQHPHQFVIDTLAPLGGCWTNGQQIMSSGEFKRLCDLTIKTVKTGELTAGVEPVKFSDVDKEFLKTTIHRIYSHLKSKIHTSDLWAAFLIQVFGLNLETVYVKKHFKEYSGNYEQVKEAMKVKTMQPRKSH